MRLIVGLVAVLLVLTACDTSDPAQAGAIIVVAMAGPTCPVETDPPDPNCAPRPVAGAPIVVTLVGRGGSAVAEGETDANGRLTLALPAGNYVVTAGPVEGLIPPADPAVATVLAGVTTEVAIGYDTGIR
jgi:hypothetical protein